MDDQHIGRHSSCNSTKENIILLLAENMGAPFPHQEAAFLKMKEAEWRLEKYSPGVINLPKHRHLAAF